jgi:hypothetical protein
MNPWATNPVWQNFSSLFREATTACEARSEIEKFHHLTASLYFGIATLEAFLNQKMRAHLSASKSGEDIFNILRKSPKGGFKSKIEKWPTDILGKSLTIDYKTLELIRLFNDIRGDLTHPKTRGLDIYERLEGIDGRSVIDSIAEYIVRFHEVQKTVFPYWLFGWNYLNPRQEIHEIIIGNEQQFAFSLVAVGFQIPAAAYPQAEEWRKHNMTTFDGYLEIKQALGSLDYCEPKNDLFPFKPILCRLWWTTEHHLSCGRVSNEALNDERNRRA